MVRWFLITILCFGYFGSAIGDDSNFISFEIETTQGDIRSGTHGDLIITFQMPPDFHISDRNGGILEVVPDSITGFRFKDAIFPPSLQKPYGGIYRDLINVKIPFFIASDVKEGNYPIFIKVIYQPCDESTGMCFLPVEKTLQTEINVISNNIENTDSETGITNRIKRSLEGGSFLSFFLIFIGGLLTSLTPCVYPMIPITIAVIGSQSEGGKLNGFILSLFYVLGVAITFSSLGMIAAKTGALFGSYVRHPVTVLLVSLIFLFMGLSMLGVFVFQLPSSLATKLRGKKRKGFLGAIFTGIIAGLVVSPCVSPLLVVILTWVAKTGSVILGFGMLFSFALGLGVLFVVLGTFSGFIKNIPKSGGWTEYIERGFGMILLVLSLIFIKPILSSHLYQFLWGIFLIILGTYLGAFYPITVDARRKDKLRKSLGVIWILVGGILILLAMLQWSGDFFMMQDSQQVKVKGGNGIDWISNDEEGFRKGRENGKRVIIDFYAEWCAACHELDDKTWSNDLVQSELKRFIPVKLDLTGQNQETQKLQKKYHIIGMPTVIVIDNSGKELFRFEGYKSPQAVVRILKEY